MRVFVGIPVAEEVKEQILKFQKELLKSGADVKLVEPQNLHFTLKFLGEASYTNVEKIKSQLKEINPKKMIKEASFPKYPINGRDTK